ncbi:alpha/beta fold hydrolase [Antrihabitans sp. YC2-6]|uniref:alpha/beta fold hydrolase n=1 Tax=Antrihabitans sp. YC2-6 TaxID=2799498 RepID=UPI0018F3A973|nr:alpha/beta hydrolase [Antrihabitans sp. YC2-6]MBJ8348809.1 alpha/beta hydrolase [Antrihabitans sp. YC2-6]
MTEPRDTRVELPAIAVAALEWGPVDGPLALCLHGFPDTAWTWRFLGPMLAERGWRVVAPFSRGYAPTSIPDDGSFHVGALMQDVLGIHEALGGDDRAVVIGHDWGAVTANGLGAFRTSPFRKVVSLAVPPIPAFTPSRSVADLIAMPRLLATQLPMSWYMMFVQLPGVSEDRLERLVPFLWRRWSPGFDATEDLRHVADSLYPSENRTAALSYYRAALRPSKPPAAYRAAQAAWTQATRVPTLYLHGVDDGCISVDFADRAAGVLPEGSAVERISGAGHFLQLEQPQEVNALIADFIGNG